MESTECIWNGLEVKLKTVLVKGGVSGREMSSTLWRKVKLLCRLVVGKK